MKKLITAILTLTLLAFGLALQVMILPAAAGPLGAASDALMTK